MKILVINPGSSSTKIALFEGEKKLSERKIGHSAGDLKSFSGIFDQYDYRLQIIKDFLNEEKTQVGDLEAVVGRGGLTRPIPCGTYLVNDKMIAEQRAGVEGVHASNLGPALAKGIADEAGIPAYIVDPITVDEMTDVARVTGRPDILRQSRLHTLNQKAVARRAAKALGHKYEEMNFVVVHLGTGTSIAAHQKGRVIDMCDARGEGPMSCDRCGGVNTYLALVKAREAAKEAAGRGEDEEVFLNKMYTQGGFTRISGRKISERSKPA